MGIEPTSSDWKSDILADVLYLQNICLLVSTKTMCFQTESNFSFETYKAYILITLRIQVTLTPFRNPYCLGSFPHPFQSVGAMCALVLVGGDAYVIYVTTRHTFQSYKR